MKLFLVDVYECGLVWCKIFFDFGILKKYVIFKYFFLIFIFYKDNIFKDIYKEKY